MLEAWAQPLRRGRTCKSSSAMPCRPCACRTGKLSRYNLPLCSLTLASFVPCVTAHDRAMSCVAKSSRVQQAITSKCSLASTAAAGSFKGQGSRATPTTVHEPWHSFHTLVCCVMGPVCRLQLGLKTCMWILDCQVCKAQRFTCTSGRPCTFVASIQTHSHICC